MLLKSFSRKITTILIFLFSILLIARSATYVFKFYIVPLYWDQWEIVRDFSERGVDIFSLRYLFRAHNEHVVATTKVFFLLDYLLFDLTNGPLVALIFALAFATALSISFLVFAGKTKGVLFLVLISVLFASSVSLAQYENLFWGFQPQFYLVGLTAVCSVLAALKMVESLTTSSRTFWFAVLCITTFLCIFSMGNGIALPVSIMIFLLFVKWRNWPMIAGYLAISALYICVDLYLTRHAAAVGDLSQRTPLNVLLFFFTMIGGPLTRSIPAAQNIGIAVFVLYILTVFKLIVVPWFTRKQLDKGVAALIALASFFFAAAVAAAWTRSPLGQGAALASRYSTPMLLLVMIWFSIWLREALVQKSEKSFVSIVILLAMVAVVAISTLREKNAAFAYEAQTRAAYFALSQVDSDEQLLKLYPDANAVRSALSWLRQNHLNIFARNGGLETPNVTDLLDVQSLDDSHICQNYAIDSVVKTSSGQLQLIGWVTDAKKQTPMWVLAFDEHGNLLGFTKPLENRPDVTEIRGAEVGFRGFILPVNMNYSERRDIEIRVISADRAAVCGINPVKIAS